MLRHASCPRGAGVYNHAAMNVIVNGEPREVAADTTVAALIEGLKLKPRNVAVELKGRLLRSEKYDTVLNDGDTVEIVTFVGGG